MTIAQRLGELHRQQEHNTHLKTFGYGSQVLLLAQMRGIDPMIVCEQVNAKKEVVDFVRAAVAPMDTTNTSQLSQYSLGVAAFLNSLRNVGVFDAALQFIRKAPLHTALGMVTAGATATATSQGAFKVTSKLGVDANQLPERKVTAITVATQELLRMLTPDAASLFIEELQGAVAYQTDVEFLNVITNSISATSSLGSFADDFSTLLNAVRPDRSAGGGRSAVFIAADPVAVQHAAGIKSTTGGFAYPQMTIDGGVLQGITIIPSDAAANKMIAFDARQLAGNGDQLRLDTSRIAGVNFEDTVANSPADSAMILHSMWQENMQAFKAERIWGVLRRRTAAVAVVDSVSYASDSPA